MTNKLIEKIIFYLKILKYKVERFDYYSYLPIIAAVTLPLFLIAIVIVLNVIQPKLSLTPKESSGLDFAASSEPIFTFDASKVIKNSSVQKDGQSVLGIKNGESVLEISGKKIVAKLIYKNKVSAIEPVISPTSEAGAKFEIKIPKTHSFMPGQYTLEVSVDSEIIKQDFTWGVLAINTDQDVYLPNSEAFLSMAVLDDEGKMVCDADLTLKIKDPALQITTKSIKGGDIIVNPECNQHSYSEKADYEATYKIVGSGEYKMELTAKTEDGTRTLKNSFYVEENPEFIIKRISATRIYPPDEYEMAFEVISKDNFSGPIKEVVPKSFIINPQRGLIVENQDEVKILNWNIDIKAGETKRITYVYRAPNISPQFYLLGELDIGERLEKTLPEETTDLQNPENSPVSGEEETLEIDPNQPIENPNNEVTENQPTEDQNQGIVFGAKTQTDETYYKEKRQWQIAADDVTGNTHPSAYTSTTGFNDNFSTTPQNAYSSNDQYASKTGSKPRNQEYATNYRGFDFSGIPDGSTINSVNVYVERKTSYANGVAEWRSSIWEDVTVAAALAPGYTGSIGDTQYATSSNPTSDTYWNFAMTTLPTAAQLKATNFGIRVQVANGNNGTATTYYIDDIYIVVDYSPPAGITISGSSNLSSGTVAVAVGGVLQSGKTGSIVSNSWEITDVTQPSTNAIITVWVDGAGDSDESTAVGKYSGSGDFTNMVLDQNVLSIGGVGNQSLSMSEVGSYTCSSDEDVMLSWSSPTLRVEGTGCSGGDNSYSTEEIDILGTDTLTVGAETLITHHLTITGTLTSSGASAYQLSGNWANAGTFTASSSTVTFNGADSSTQIISGSSSFNNFTASTSGNSAGRTLQFTGNSTQTVTGTWTITGFSGKVITLQSSDTNNWTINPTAASVTYVSVSRSTNSGTSFCATYSTDGGYNNSWDISPTGSCNQNPNDPSSLAQLKTDDSSLNTGDWTNETSVKFTATVSDPDSDQVQLCVEKDNLATSFSDTEDLCGSLVDSGQTASVTISSQTDDTQYHWQARTKDDNGAYSSWVSYGGNGEGEQDYGIDTSAPTGGTINDGLSGDQDWNDGDLDTLEANWSGFDSSVSGLNKYEYAIRRSDDDYYWSVCSGSGTWQAAENWCDNSTTTSFTQNTINLHTGESYYISVKTTDNAGNTASAVNSDGQQVLPILSFSLSGNVITFADLNDSNGWTDTETSTITTSTNAFAGYIAQAYETSAMTSLSNPADTISDYAGLWSSPAGWSGGTYGFGYTSNDSLVQGSNRFGDSPCPGGGTPGCYAQFSQSAPGDIVADHTSSVSGDTGAVSNEQFEITYKVAVSTSQPAATYQTYVIYIVTANF